MGIKLRQLFGPMTFPAYAKSLVQPLLLPVSIFVMMLAVSWRRWTALIVDFGRESDLPFRLLNGEMLYRDIHYTYTPFSPYFNALLFQVFGVHADTLAVSGMLLSALLGVLCYRIFRKLMPPVETAIATSFILILCVFKPGGNLILPYSFGALHGAIFGLTSVLFLTRFDESKRKLELIAVGVFIGLAAISKQEFGFAAAVTVFIYLIYLHRTNLSKILIDLAYSAIPALAITISVLAYFFANIDWQILVDDCHLFYTNIPKSLVLYNQFRSGMNDPVGSFIQMIGAAALCVAVTVLIVLLSDRTAELRSRLMVLLAMSSVVTLLVLYIYIEQWDGSPFRAIPVLLVAYIFVEWRGRSKLKFGADESNRGGILFIVAVYSLAILSRLIFRVPSGGFSGSFYLPTSLGLLFFALLVKLPEAVRNWTRDEVSFLRARLIVRSICCVAIIATAISFGLRYRSKFVYEINAMRGSIIIEKHSGSVIDQALQFIASNTSPGEFIAIFPEGNDLAFLTGRRINSRHQVLIPDFLSEQDEINTIAAIMRDNVRFIFIVNRPMREFGSEAFGRDFYQTLGGWIENNYQVRRVFGETDDPQVRIGKAPFFIKVYELKGVPDVPSS